MILFVLCSHQEEFHNSLMISLKVMVDFGLHTQKAVWHSISFQLLNTSSLNFSLC